MITAILVVLNNSALGISALTSSKQASIALAAAAFAAEAGVDYELELDDDAALGIQ